MNHSLFSPKSLAFIAALSLFAASSIWLWRPDMSWHDQQRMAELSILIVGLLLAPAFLIQHLPKLQNIIVGSIFILGLTSAVNAAQYFWALVELARFLALIALLLIFAQQPSLAIVSMALITAAALAHTLQFIAYYTAAINTAIFNFQPDVMTSGFSNRRFFAQFHTIAISLVVFWTQQLFFARKMLWALLLLVLLVVQWTIAFHLGGRGQLIALTFAHAALLTLAPHHWPLLRMQACAAMLGFFLYGFMFKLAPMILSLDAAPTTFMRNSLSGRGLLWERAWTMATEHPWLGVGPMGFAAVSNPIAAHPHQMVLQWLAEWGFIATACALLLISLGLWRGLKIVRRPESTSLDATLLVILISMLALAQVDGVLVMPYTGVWLMAIAGLAMNRWTTLQPPGSHVRLINSSVCIFAAAMLAAVLVPELPAVINKNSELPSYFIGWKPRFWIDGWISGF